MTYGLEKYSAADMRKAALAEIEQEMIRCDIFNNPSLAYYGMKLSFTAKFTMYTRVETERTVQAEAGIGLPEARMDFVTIKGKRVTGNKLTVPEGSHVRPLHGEPV